MNANLLHYSLFGIAGGQEEVNHTYVKFVIYPFTMIAVNGFARHGDTCNPALRSEIL